MTPETFVIVGAGLAGAKAAETLREEDFTGRLVLVGDEAELPYDRLLIATGASPRRPPIPGIERPPTAPTSR